MRGVVSVPTDFLADFVVPLPPLNEQKNAVTFLDRETAKIDLLIAKQSEFLALLSEHRRALITEAVTRGLDASVPLRQCSMRGICAIPAGWKLTAIRHLVSLSTSGPRGWSDFLTEAGSRFFQSQNIGRAMEPVFESAARVMPPEGPDAQRATLAEDDIVVCITGARTSAVAHIKYLPERSYVNQHVCLLRPLQDKIMGRYLSYCLWSDVGQNQLDFSSYGLKQGLALDDIRSVVVPLPDRATQRAIVDYLDSVVVRLGGVQASALQMIEQLRERRSALITAVVTGQLDVKGDEIEQAA
jgi:type I restriction enzyme S subunit